uniref:Butyrophilin subfamily 1 member A1 n=1 Tax=Suricata suricatta TaxID=37032 RepID=A0A673TIE3_SURSU
VSVKGFPDVLWRHYSCLEPLILSSLWLYSTDSFLVISPSEPIVAMLGTDAMLPCHVFPAMSVENMELRWLRSEFSEAASLVDFKGRTELVKDYITEGRVSVRIYSLRISDSGIYKCFFKKGSDFQEATLELKVIGVGSGPRVFMVGPEDTGIRLTCTGKGWFPQPEVQWKDATGEKISSLSEVETQDDEGLFQIEASLIVRDRSKREVSCSMKNPFFGQEQVETISIPESFFPRASPWMAAFAGTFLILGIFLGNINCFTSSSVALLHIFLHSPFLVFVSFLRPTSIHCGMTYFSLPVSAVAVTLDPDRVHPNLKLSENRKKVSLMENAPENCDASVNQGPGESETIFSVLGQNCFTTGRHYWEIEVNIGTEVGPETRWAVGVCSDTVNTDGWFVESPEKDVWVIAYKKGVLTSPQGSLSLRQHPQRIGVFLDWEDGDVSFYNMVGGSHIYSFSGITFYGTLCPYLSLQGPSTLLQMARFHSFSLPCSTLLYIFRGRGRGKGGGGNGGRHLWGRTLGVIWKPI